VELNPLFVALKQSVVVIPPEDVRVSRHRLVPHAFYVLSTKNENKGNLGKGGKGGGRFPVNTIHSKRPENLNIVPRGQRKERAPDRIVEGRNLRKNWK
jgi:hypothetical protein